MDYFDYGLNNPVDIDINKLLEESKDSEADRLEQELTRINQQLEEREQIREENVDELQSKLDWYIERIETLYQRSTAKTVEKKDLKQRIEDFYLEIRREKRQAWSDKQELEKERRSLVRERAELQDTAFIKQLLEATE